jgi:Na+-transporting methylmalonyl-CoA/oxaloacetate decarboxylase gamma subunit
MEFTDALTITGLGMAVVFSGLLLTAGLIFVFGRLQTLIDASREKPDEGPSTGSETTESAALAAGPPVDPEILTVIATVLEIEYRLQRVAAVPRNRSGSE